jgi:predicted protein tyrosine phosphatase
MMSPVTYVIAGPWTGQLAIVPRPRGGEWLADELRGLKNSGFDTVLSLLTPEEANDLGISDEPGATATNGMQFFSFPISDLGVPDEAPTTRAFLRSMLDQLQGGKHIAIHCRQGIGRSGLIAASLLVTAGIDPLVALRRVSAARGIEVPETAQQRDWIIELAHDIPELVRS